MKKADFLFLLKSYAIWRIALLILLFIALRFIPLQNNFLGGGKTNYLQNPLLWSGVNFDGEHYLAIAREGYKPLTYFFFPVYPLLVRTLGNVFRADFSGMAMTGILISHIAFLLGLIGLWKYMEKDYTREVIKRTILLILIFPTSFFFVSFYTESLFFAVTIWAFYFAKKEKWLYAALLGGIASATRVIGALVTPAFFVKIAKEKKYMKMVYLLLIPAGILIYMYYLKITTGDALNFLNTVSIFGSQRSSHLVILPQVFYRYVFKILPGLNYGYLPGVFSTYLEFIAAVLFLILSVVAFWKLKIEESIYLALGYLVPTLAGSFSSMTRYVLVLFPGFILMSLYIVKLPKLAQFFIVGLSILGLSVGYSLFITGIWVA